MGGVGRKRICGAEVGPPGGCPCGTHGLLRSGIICFAGNVPSVWDVAPGNFTKDLWGEVGGEVLGEGGCDSAKPGCMGAGGGQGNAITRKIVEVDMVLPPAELAEEECKSSCLGSTA